MTMEMTKPTRFWDRIAENYAKKPVADEAAYQKKLQVTRGYFRPDMTVLEFGCGTGTTAIAQAPYVKHIHATDISAKMLEIARRKAAAAKVKNISFAQATLDDLDDADESYDAVMGHSILHLLEDRDAAIAKVHRLLRPGGVFVTSTVCLGDGMRYLKLIAPVGRLIGFMPMVRVFTANQLEASLTACGFRIDHRWLPPKGKSAFNAVFIVARKDG